MGLDVRVPVGLMLGIMGTLLLAYGLLGDQSIYARSLGLNINAIWGSVLLVAAAVFLILASRRPHAAAGDTVDAGRR
jgi:hypothetical protein